MMLQLNSLRKKEYQAIMGIPGMVGCLATIGTLSWSDFGRFDSHTAVIAKSLSESLSEILNDEPNHPTETKYALFPPRGNRKMEV